MEYSLSAVFSGLSDFSMLDTTAMPFAPLSITLSALSTVMPPSAITGILIFSFNFLSDSVPVGSTTPSLEGVLNIGP